MAARMVNGGVDALDDVQNLVRTRVAGDQKAALEAFVARYYGQVDPEDLAERRPGDLYGAALSHWNFARKREAAHARVRVFNPSIVEHGWQSTHTIIEIVNDDMPFLVDSVTMEVNRQGLTLHLIVHPIIPVRRTPDGILVDVSDDPAAPRESFIHVEVDRMVDPARMSALALDLARVLEDVRVTVTDWTSMRARVTDAMADVERHPPPLPADEVVEGVAFLRRLADNQFTFIG